MASAAIMNVSEVIHGRIGWGVTSKIEVAIFIKISRIQPNLEFLMQANYARLPLDSLIPDFIIPTFQN